MSAAAGPVSSPTMGKTAATRPARRKDRRADPSLESTINSISSNIEFKRMLIFGLRTLSQLCSTSNRQFVDNSFTCIEKGVIEMLNTIAQKHSKDGEVLNLVARTVQGFCRALVQEPDEDIKVLARDSQLCSLCSQLLEQSYESISDPSSSIWEVFSSILRDAVKLGWIVAQGQSLVTTLAEQSKATTSIPWVKAECLLSSYISLCSLPASEVEKYRDIALMPFLTLVQRIVSSSSSTRFDKAQDALLQQAVGSSLVLIDPSDAKSDNTEVVAACIKLLDSTEHMKPLQSAISQILAKLITPKQVEACVAQMSKGGATAALSSLDLLRAFSYVPECGEKWAGSGGIPVLCHVVKSTVSIDLKDKSTSQALSAACHMIATLSKNPEYAKQFTDLDCSTSLTSLALKCSSSGDPALLSAILKCLVNLGRFDGGKASLKSMAASNDLIKVLCDGLENNKKQSDASGSSSLVSVCLELLYAILQVDSGPQVIKLLLSNKVDQRIVKLLSGDGRTNTCADLELEYQILNKLNDSVDAEKQLEWVTAVTSSFRQLEHKDVSAASAGLHLIQNMDASIFKKLAISQHLLTLALTFSSEPNILIQIRRLLEHTATEADIKAAVASLAKHASSSKSNPNVVLDAIAAINGLAGIERLRDAVRAVEARETVVKAIETLVAANHHSQQQRLISVSLDCLGTLHDALPPTSCTESCIALMSIVNSNAMKNLLTYQLDAEDNNLLDMLRAVHRTAAFDIFEDSNSINRVVEAVSICMRKYPEHRRAQIICIEILTTLLASKSADATTQFIQSGVAKQILTFLAKAAVQEELQRLGLRLVLVCAQRNSQNAEALRMAGAMDTVRAAGRTHTGKAEIQKLVAHLTRLLTPEDQAKAEVSDQMNLLKLAGKNRDLLTGREALKCLAEMTVAAESAKHAAKNGVGDTVNAFYECMRSASASVEEMEVCSLGATSVLRNIASVGRPHSSLILKANGLFLIKAILEDVMQAPSSPTVDELYVATLEAGRLLLAHEKNPYIVPGAPEFQNYLLSILPKVLKDEKIDVKIIPLVSTIGVQTTGKLMSNNDFNKGLQLCVTAMRNSKSEVARVNNLRCLYQLFCCPNAKSTATVFATAGGCDLLMGMLETYAESEPETITWTRKVLEKIVTHSDDGAVRLALTKRGGAAEACKAFGRSLGHCKDDAEAATTAVNLLNHFTAKMDRVDLLNTGVLEMIENVVEIHSKDRELRNAVAHLLGNFGADTWLTEYFEEVINLLNARPLNWRRDLLTVLHKLEMFIPADVEDIEKSFSGAPAAVKKMASCLMEFKADGEVLPALMLVCDRLEDRFHTDPHSPYGAKCLVPEMMESVIKLLMLKDPSAGTLQMRLFLRNTYNMLDGLVTVKNPEVYDKTMKFIVANKFLEQSWHLLERYPKDTEVTTAIITFLSHFPHDPDSYRYLEESRDAAPAHLQKNKCKEMADAFVATIWQLRRDPVAVGQAVRAMANVLSQSKNPKDVLDGDSGKKLKELAGQSPQAAAAYAALLDTILQREDGADAKYDQLFEDALNLLVQQWLKIKDDESVPDADKDDLLRELGNLTTAYVHRGRQDPIRSMGVPAILADALKQLCEDKGVVESLAIAFKALHDMQDVQDLILTRVCPILFVDAGEVVASDPSSATPSLELLLKVLQETHDAPNFLSGLNGLRETLENVIIMSHEQPPQIERHLLELVTAIQALLDTKQQKSTMTLEEVYRRWSHRKEAGEDLDLAESGVLMNEFSFVVQATEEYSKGNLLRMADIPTREFTFGCLCFGLLHEKPRNVELAIDKNCQAFFMQALARDIDMEIGQYIINAALPALTHKPAKVAWSAVPKAADIAVQAVNKLHKAELSSPDRKEIFLTKRLEFMEKLSSSRTFYDGSDALKVLNDIWLKVDADVYTLDVLKSVARVLRCLVNEYWADDFLKLDIPDRLLKRIDDSTSPYSLLIDLLFCVGSMASVLSIKTAIGDAEGVEKIVDVLRRCEKVQNKTIEVSSTQQNACLALGALVIVHGPNANTFHSVKGIDLALRVLRASMTGKVDYDVANAATVLITNLSFQRDDFKEILGKRGAPSALLLIMQNYDGVDTDSATRCLISMFKGIQNLALIPQNTQRFLAEDISGSLNSFYLNSQKQLKDSLILHSLKTLSNLTLENSEDFMREFGQLMPRLLAILEDSTRSDAEMLSFIFETFASLCRLEDNRKTFVQSRGVDIVLKYLNSIKDERVYEQGLALLAVLACDSVAVDNMLHSNIFQFILSLLDDAESLNADLIIAGLKVIRRLVLNDKSAADAFIESSPTSLLCDVLCGASSQANNDAPSSVTCCECLRILLQLLHLHPADYGSEADRNSEVIQDPSWRKSFTSSISGGSAGRSRSFSRLFQSTGTGASGGANSRSTSVTSSVSSSHFGAGDTTRPTTSTGGSPAGGESSTPSNGDIDMDGSPVALDSPPTMYNRDDSTHTHTHNNGNGIYKPRSPRAYEKVGLDARNCVAVCQSLYTMLLTQDSELHQSLKLTRLNDFSMAFIAYVVSEKMDGCILPFINDGGEALSEFVIKIYAEMKEKNCEEKKRLVFEGTELLCNLLCLLDTKHIKLLASNEAAMGSIKSCSNSLHPKRDANLKRKVEELWALLQTDPSIIQPSIFYPLATYDFPVTTVDFNKDMYPNGVHDLNQQIKKKIRRGGKCQFIYIDNEKGGTDPSLQTIYWKSSSDLSQLVVVTDKKTTNTETRIPVSRLRVIDRGLNGTTLVRQYATELKLWAGSTCSLVASPAPGLPDGVELVLVFPTRFHCRKFYYRLREWQCAATV